MKEEKFLKAPFPYMGGKSQAAQLIWQLLGPDVKQFVDPMMGSLSVLLARPREYVHAPGGYRDS